MSDGSIDFIFVYLALFGGCCQLSKERLREAFRETAILMTQSHPIGNSLKEMIQLTTDAIEDLIEAFFGGVRGNAQEEDIQDH